MEEDFNYGTEILKREKFLFSQNNTYLPCLAKAIINKIKTKKQNDKTGKIFVTFITD